MTTCLGRIALENIRKAKICRALTGIQLVCEKTSASISERCKGADTLEPLVQKGVRSGGNLSQANRTRLAVAHRHGASTCHVFGHW